MVHLGEYVVQYVDPIASFVLKKREKTHKGELEGFAT
jgi:hypothetical protein